MAKDRENSLEKLENHLMTGTENPVSSARVYNGDRTDVDIEQFSDAVCQKPKHGCIGWLLLLLAAALAVFLFLVLGGKMPWN